MKSIKVRLTSEHTLLMNSNAGVNPTHPITKKLKELTSKRKKTDEDSEEILMLKWELSMYHDPQIGPYIPAQNVEATLREAAKMTRRGKDVVRSIRVDPDYIPLQYDGPRDIESLSKDPKFRDIRVGRIQRASILIARARFDHWAIEFTLQYDESVFSDNEIEEILITAGKYVGLCDYRPRYGTFSHTILT